MSKEKRRGNREAKKPKAAKAKEPVVASFSASLTKPKPTPDLTGKKKTI
jgi:hypothetical protein